jgi:hypothetical protein
MDKDLKEVKEFLLNKKVMGGIIGVSFFLILIQTCSNMNTPQKPQQEKIQVQGEKVSDTLIKTELDKKIEDALKNAIIATKQEKGEDAIYFNENRILIATDKDDPLWHFAYIGCKINIVLLPEVLLEHIGKLYVKNIADKYGGKDNVLLKFVDEKDASVVIKKFHYSPITGISVEK